MNTVLIQWFYNKKSTIDTSVFGAEFLSLKIVMYTLGGIRYKLRIMGVTI